MLHPAFPGYIPRPAPGLSVENNIADKMAALPVVYSNPNPLFRTYTDMTPPSGLQDWIEKIIADAVTAEEGRLFLGAVSAVILGGLLLKWL